PKRNGSGAARPTAAVGERAPAPPGGFALRTKPAAPPKSAHLQPSRGIGASAPTGSVGPGNPQTPQTGKKWLAKVCIAFLCSGFVSVFLCLFVVVALDI